MQGFRFTISTGHQWLTPVIPSYSGSKDQEDHDSKPARPYLKKTFTKIGVVEWLKMKALRSNPSTAKKKGSQSPKSFTTTL
jgi:hypothetical protein